jgi:hypothetical protein
VTFSIEFPAKFAIIPVENIKKDSTERENSTAANKNDLIKQEYLSEFYLRITVLRDTSIVSSKVI